MLGDEGTIRERADRLLARLSPCDICPRLCRVDRSGEAAGDTAVHGDPPERGRLRRAAAAEGGRWGVCRTGRRAVVASYGAHYGEEAPLVGFNGSGTVFFSGCNLRCVFCQNYEISHLMEGEETSAEKLASLFLAVQAMGCHNLNLVTPTHVTPQIVEALAIASAGGLSVPVVYNCGGYEGLDTLRALEGIVDIYMPDVKFLDAAPAARYCAAPDYPEVVRAALKEMARQVGPLELDRRGIARRGLLVRHLVMPGGASTTRQVIDFLADEIGEETYLNIMDQYRPCGRAAAHPEIGRRISPDEWRDARGYARSRGISRLDGEVG